MLEVHSTGTAASKVPPEFEFLSKPNFSSGILEQPPACTEIVIMIVSP